MAERGGNNAKKRAVVAVARKLAVLLHRLLGYWRHLPPVIQCGHLRSLTANSHKNAQQR